VGTLIIDLAALIIVGVHFSFATTLLYLGYAVVSFIFTQFVVGQLLTVALHLLISMQSSIFLITIAWIANLIWLIKATFHLWA
jgi:hypothetical protein